MHDGELVVTATSHAAGPRVLAVAGDLDHHTAPQLREAVEDLDLSPATPLIIDLSGVDYCDSTGLTVLIGAHRQTTAAGALLALTGTRPDLNRVFSLVGLDQMFTFRPTVEDAVRTFRS